MDQLNWWEPDATGYCDTLIAFEDSVFEAFPTVPPPKEMPMIFNKVWHGDKWIPYEAKNNDVIEVSMLLNWYPWPRLIGYRAIDLGDMLRIYPSIEALRYYSPALMLHWLYFRHEVMAVNAEIKELFIPPDDEIICEAFSGYGLRNERYYDGFYIDRFYWFRDGMTVEQRKVCREFCTLFIPWNYRNIDFSLVEEAYLRLLSYWE